MIDVDGKRGIYFRGPKNQALKRVHERLIMIMFAEKSRILMGGRGDGGGGGNSVISVWVCEPVF